MAHRLIQLHTLRMRNEFVSPFRRSFLKGICRPENRRQFFIESSHWHTHNWGGGGFASNNENV